VYNVTAFSGHSVGLFSIHDSPPETSARTIRSSTLSPSTRKRARTSTPRLETVAEGSWDVASSRGGSPGTGSEIRRMSPPLINGHHNDDQPMSCYPEEEAPRWTVRTPVAGPVSPHSPPHDSEKGLERQLSETERNFAGPSRVNLPQPEPSLETPKMRSAHESNGHVDTEHVQNNDTVPSSSTIMRSTPEEPPPEAGQDADIENDWEDDDSNMSGLERLMTRAARRELELLGDEDDEDGDDDDDDDDDEMEDTGLYPASDELDVYPSVPYVYPRMKYTGARNVQTVKDGKLVITVLIWHALKRYNPIRSNILRCSFRQGLFWVGRRQLVRVGQAHG
jgi:hypothetical protein